MEISVATAQKLLQLMCYEFLKGSLVLSLYIACHLAF